MDGYVTIATELDTKEFDAQIDYVKSQLDDIEDKLKQADMGFDVGDTLKLEAQYEKLTQKLKNLIKKKQEFNQKGFDFSGIKESIDGVGTAVKKTTKKIAKMALAVFGIRSAFMFVRNAINTIANDDEQLKADIDYMKKALAYTLEPVVRGIVELAKQLMFYVGYIVKAWTGINIFENANKSLKSANKQAKELKKTTASFDEMNVLSDNSSNGSGVTTPSFDLTKPEDYPIPGWIQWIADNGDMIKEILLGIAGALVVLKLGFGPLKALGIGIALVGIYKTIKAIKNFIKDPSFKNFMKILEGIALAVIGIATAFAAWPVAIAAAIALVIIEILKDFDEIKGYFETIASWFDNEFKNMLIDIFGPFGEIIYLPFKLAIDIIGTLFNDLVGGLKLIIEGIIQIFTGDFVGGLSTIFDGLISILRTPFDLLTVVVSDTINAVIGFFSGLWDGIKDVVQGIWDTITGIFGAMGEWIYNHTIKPIADMFGGLADKISGFFDTIGKGVGKVGSFFGNVGKGIGGFFGFQKGGIIVPRLASGGIINQPGRGVPLASAIAGERGTEGVIPLTDSQQMELLGASIGKYITINLTNINEMNGRTLSRELKRIQSDNDFAYNR